MRSEDRDMNSKSAYKLCTDRDEPDVQVRKSLYVIIHDLTRRIYVSLTLITLSRANLYDSSPFDLSSVLHSVSINSHCTVTFELNISMTPGGSSNFIMIFN